MSYVIVPFGKGAMAQGQIKTRSSPRLEPTLPNLISETKEESHGEEEEGQEENQVLNIRRAPRIGAAPVGPLRFRGVIDLAKRLNGVRPLLFCKTPICSIQA